jgi:hypothetical protein
MVEKLCLSGRLCDCVRFQKYKYLKIVLSLRVGEELLKNFEKGLVYLEVSERELGLTSVLALVLNECSFTLVLA